MPHKHSANSAATRMHLWYLPAKLSAKSQPMPISNRWSSPIYYPRNFSRRDMHAYRPLGMIKRATPQPIGCTEFRGNYFSFSATNWGSHSRALFSTSSEFSCFQHVTRGHLTLHVICKSLYLWENRHTGSLYLWEELLIHEYSHLILSWSQPMSQLSRALLCWASTHIFNLDIVP